MSRIVTALGAGVGLGLLALFAYGRRDRAGSMSEEVREARRHARTQRAEANVAEAELRAAKALRREERWDDN